MTLCIVAVIIYFLLPRPVLPGWTSWTTGQQLYTGTHRRIEAIVVSWCFKTSKVLEQINMNTRKFKMPAWWFNISIKVVAPVILAGLFVWNIVALFMGGGVYGAADGLRRIKHWEAGPSWDCASCQAARRC